MINKLEIMQQENFYPFEACEQYVNLLQENITRMANNSANCKAWLVAIITGVFAISGKAESIDVMPIIYIALGAFYFLDCFYLGQERLMRDAEKVFISKVRKNADDVKDYLFSFKPEKLSQTTDTWKQKFVLFFKHVGKQLWSTIKGMFSWSTTLFYGLILIGIIYIQHNLIGYACSCMCH